MPYDKGDFTQQGINGDVSALVRLNEKRVMKVVLSSDDESDNCDISGKVYDLLNGTSYDLGGTTPTGTIAITDTSLTDVAEYRYAQVSVENLVAGNIKKDVAILGISGTFEDSSYTLITSLDVEVNTTSTSEASVTKTAAFPDLLNGDKIIMGIVHDKAGKRNGYFYQTIAYIIEPPTSVSNSPTQTFYVSDGGSLTLYNGYYGVYVKQIINDNGVDRGKIEICSRYNSVYSKTINGTYQVDIYTLKYPDGYILPW